MCRRLAGLLLCVALAGGCACAVPAALVGIAVTQAVVLQDPSAAIPATVELLVPPTELRRCLADP